jgi:exopolysaccharide production protein ExoZ
VTVASVDRRPIPPLLSIQALRAVAAAMVLAYHMAGTAAYGWKSDDGGAMSAVGAVARSVGFAGVDLFFVISGVVMVYSSYDRLGERSEIAPFLKRRVARIYPLYWVCTAAVLALAALAPQLTSRDKLNVEAAVKSLLLWPQSEYPLVGVGWTLTFEMYFYVVFSALIALPRRMLPAALVVWAVATVGAFIAVDRPEFRETAEAQLRLPLIASPLALEFIAGCFIGWQARRRPLSGGAAALILGAAMILALGSGVINSADLHYGLARVASFGMASALIVFGAVCLEQRGEVKVSSLLQQAGNASYSLYLTHMYVLWALAAAWPQESSENAATSRAMTLSLAAIGACAIVAAASYQLIERPLHRLALRTLGVNRRDGPGATVLS